MLRNRRRPRYSPQICAVIAALLLLFSVSLLYTRLSSSPQHSTVPSSFKTQASEFSIAIDKIDEQDTIKVEGDHQSDINEDQNDTEEDTKRPAISSSGYYMDHVTGSIRRYLNKKSIEDYDFSDYNSNGFSLGLNVDDYKSKTAFGSDDIVVDEEVKRKLSEVKSIEDALLLKIGKKVSPLREGWGDWFDKKSDFLRRDKMFKSNLEVLNPLTNPLLQDPDGVGVTGLTRGDKVMQKMILSEFKRNPFGEKRSLSGLEMIRNAKGDNNLSANENLVDNSSDVGGETRQMTGMENKRFKDHQRKPEELSHIFADGKRWGYFPDMHPHLSFSDFMASFFRNGKCEMRVFMVWNSPPWMHSVRHQRGLESLLSHHRDACVVIFSETIDLDFFKDSFVKDGYKVAVAMPNLDELLKDTPTHIFTSVWFHWRKTKYYPTHYSELVRLAALYKYGGIYLDSDIIVLNSLSSLDNTVGLENPRAGSSLNGAVMAFRKHSPFITKCLNEFYMTYDDTRLRWNGADLLTRVASKFLSKENKSINQELKVQPSYIFFPISSQNITSYFTTPENENEKAHQDALFEKILSESLTFHFWNSLTSTLTPESGSLVSRLIDHSCIRCFDVL
ncbi:alpha 1,4-glycosyltransferase family protein [Salix suchowensis]|nr:alpha 1,4-glycosyltransferase family protein [Salix suchowensis]